MISRVALSDSILTSILYPSLPLANIRDWQQYTWLYS